jgi:hypothetical protein
MSGVDDVFRELIPRPYKDRIVGYLDILGWSELLRASEETPGRLHPVMRAAVNLVAARQTAEALGAKALQAMDLKASQFSDCFVVSAYPGRCGHLTGEQTVAMQLEVTTGLLLRAGIYTRGALVRGGLFHDKDLLFGPALVRAYKIERDVSRFPRIVVDRDVVRVLDPSTVRLDYDGLTYLHALRYVRKAELHRLARVVRKRIGRDHDKLELLTKHTWMWRYLGETLRSEGSASSQAKRDVGKSAR